MNVVSAWLLSGGSIITAMAMRTVMRASIMTRASDHDRSAGVVALEVFEDGVPPRFRLAPETDALCTGPAENH